MRTREPRQPITTFRLLWSCMDLPRVCASSGSPGRGRCRAPTCCWRTARCHEAERHASANQAVLMGPLHVPSRHDRLEEGKYRDHCNAKAVNTGTATIDLA